MHRLRSLSFLIILCISVGSVYAQDGLNLPAPLYVLLNEGLVQRYGQGAEGISVVTPEDRFVVDFGLSPDGNSMAYRTETDMILRDLSAGTERSIDTGAGVPPVRGRGETVAWSPAGDALAVSTEFGGRVYLGISASTDSAPTAVDLREGVFSQLLWSPDGVYLAAEAAEGVWWVYRRDAGTIALSSAIVSAVGATFVNNTELVFAPADGGLILMNLANANAQTVLLDNTWNYNLPFLLPDGMLAVFGRQKTDAELEATQGRLLGLKPGVAEITYLSEVPVVLDNLRWAPGGSWLTSFTGGVFSLIEPISGQVFTLPVTGAVAYTWGPIIQQTS